MALPLEQNLQALSLVVAQDGLGDSCFLLWKQIFACYSGLPREEGACSIHAHPFTLFPVPTTPLLSLPLVP